VFGVQLIFLLNDHLVDGSCTHIFLSFNLLVVHFAALILLHLVRDSLISELNFLPLHVVKEPWVRILRPEVRLNENTALLQIVFLALNVALNLTLQCCTKLFCFSLASSLLILNSIIHNVDFLEKSLSLLNTFIILLLD